MFLTPKCLATNSARVRFNSGVNYSVSLQMSQALKLLITYTALVRTTTATTTTTTSCSSTAYICSSNICSRSPCLMPEIVVLWCYGCW